VGDGTFIGIDGGGTGSRAVLADSAGNPLATAEGGPLNPYAVTRPVFDANLDRLTRELLEDARLTSSDVSGLGAGLAGVRTPSEREAIRDRLSRRFPEAKRIRVTHDLAVALLGATTSGNGVVVVAGTGAAAFGRHGEREEIVGGWGRMFGDEGSGYWVGLQALRGVARAEDGREEETALRDSLLKMLGLGVVRDLVAWSEGADKAGMARLAEVVLDCAKAGDRMAARILEAGAGEIALLARTVVHRLERQAGGMEIALAGGLMNEGSRYYPICRDRILREIPGVQVTRPLRDPVYGALRLAMAGAD
jgi:N-acetylglucosamine kinase-like BadF-type ATPase